MPATSTCRHHLIIDRHLVGVCRFCGRTVQFPRWPETEVTVITPGVPPASAGPDQGAAAPTRPKQRHHIDRELLLYLGPAAYADRHGLGRRSRGLLARNYRMWGGPDPSIGRPAQGGRPQADPPPAAVAPASVLHGRSAERLGALRRILHDLAELI